jgi:hypothetical protein
MARLSESRRHIESANARLGAWPVGRLGGVELREPRGANVGFGFHAAKTAWLVGRLKATTIAMGIVGDLNDFAVEFQEGS